MKQDLSYITRRCSAFFAAFLLCLMLVDCSAEKKHSPAVAKVNDRVILSEEFAFSYELSPRQITNQPREQAYPAALNQLIDRILLAQQAEILGLADSDTLLQKAVELYKRQAVNRELYLKYIRNPISIQEEEEREAFLRSCKTLHVKHFASSLESEISHVLSGQAPWIHSPMYYGVNTLDSPLYGQVDAVSWNDVAPDLEEVLYSLPLHEISEPIFDGRQYHIFKVVDYEKNILVRENDFQANRESIHGVIRKRKESRTSAKFIRDIMDPQNLVIKADALLALTEHLWNKRPAGTESQMNYIPDEEIRYINDFEEEIVTRPIAEFTDGTMTISDILVHYKVNPQRVDYKSKAALRESIKNAVALYVRDWVFSEKGIREKLDRKPSVKEETQTRKEHLLAQKMIRSIYRDCPDSIKHDYEFQMLVDDHVKELRKRASIEIDQELLMSINTSDKGLSRKIDFIVVPSQ
jgi:hypothetical protein